MIGSRVARRYAKALLGIGQDDGRYADYGEDLKTFAELCESHREFYDVISNPIFSVEERKGVLDAVLEKAGFSNTVNSFLRLLLEKNRIGAIKDIRDYYERLTDELSNVTRAEVVTAKPLEQDALGRLQSALAGLTGKSVKLKVAEDAGLIGGVVVKLGDTVLDGSVKAQLQGLKESLKRGELS